MKTILFSFLIGICLPYSPAFASPAGAATPRGESARTTWVTAYYPVWHQQDGTLPPGRIDFTAFSHLVHFSVVPRADGTIDDTPVKPDTTITAAESAAVVGPAHAAGRKVLLCVGGAESAARFRPALADAVRPRLIASLVGMAVARGYDGLDIDMEPITDADAPHYEAFIRELRGRMDAARPGLLLTAATALQPTLFSRLQRQFDQINLMTYDLSGPWQGFKTWHNSALYGADGQTMSPGAPYPSTEKDVLRFVQAGIDRKKLGIGIAFYGDVWSGATGPRQSIQGVTAVQLAYSGIMDTYYQPPLYRWDAEAHAPYLTIDSPRPAGRKFVSFDDERLCAEKVTYARQHGLGGVIIWELGDGYRPRLPEGQRNPLLQAVKRAWLAPLPPKPSEATRHAAATRH